VEKVLEEQFGLAADRVTSVGYGEERPIATNDTVDGRATNRRVVGEISTVVKTMKTK
jgi:OOP family OmpA-OmpF porin